MTVFLLILVSVSFNDSKNNVSVSVGSFKTADRCLGELNKLKLGENDKAVCQKSEVKE